MKKYKKKALITGMPGMDASHLADYLISLGYEVYGLIRRSSNRNYQNISHLMNHTDFHLIQGDSPVVEPNKEYEQLAIN